MEGRESQLKRLHNFADDKEMQNIIEELEAFWREKYKTFRSVSLCRGSSMGISPDYSARTRELVHGLAARVIPIVRPISGWEYRFQFNGYPQTWHYDPFPVSILRFKGPPTNVFVGVPPEEGYEPRRHEVVSTSSGDLISLAPTDYHKRSSGTPKQNKEWRQALLFFHTM